MEIFDFHSAASIRMAGQASWNVFTWENNTKMDLVQDLVQWLALLLVLLKLSFLLSQSSLGLTEIKNEYQ